MIEILFPKIRLFERYFVNHLGTNNNNIPEGEIQSLGDETCLWLNDFIVYAQHKHTNKDGYDTSR